MAEKYKGILPPGSVWYQLKTKDATKILEQSILDGKLDPIYINDLMFKHEKDNLTELQAPKNESDKLEKILKEYGEEIRTLQN